MSSLATGRVLRSVREQITALLREDILCGRIPTGERLSEIKLAERFGVSRGPIREALAQLTHEGLLISKPNCGVSVAPLPNEEIIDLVVPMRRTIETYALKLYYDELNEQDFHAWDEIVLKLELAGRNGNFQESVLQDIAFHRFLIARSGQPDLLAIWQTILVRSRGYFCNDAHHRQLTLQEIAEEHRVLVEAFRSGDKAAAVKALEAHIW
jgi:DNA-binding GntR family transcriptional regulator